MEQNNIRHYLLYAIGEIFLVVVGILLALQVNNWNEEQKKAAILDDILIQISQDLQRNLTDMKGDLVIHQEGYRSNLTITRALTNKEPYSEEMAFDFWFIKVDEYIYPITRGYNNLKDIGMRSLKNPELEDHLQTAYESLMPRLTRTRNFHPDMDEYFSHYYQEHFRYNTNPELKYEVVIADDTLRMPQVIDTPFGEEIRTYGYIPLNYEELSEDNQFMLLLRESIRFREYKLRRYDSLIRTSETIIRLIEDELGREVKKQLAVH